MASAMLRRTGAARWSPGAWCYLHRAPMYTGFGRAHDDEQRGDGSDQHVPPWASTVLTGVDLMRNNKYNKGLAFTREERDKFFLRGLLPAAVLGQDIQAERVVVNIRAQRSDVDRLAYLLALAERNERLFHHVLRGHLAELLPVLQHPTTARYCERFSLMFRSLPRGLFVSLEDAGSVTRLLQNWPMRRVKLVSLTDGSALGAGGDWGVQSIGSPLSRLALMTAVGGVHPSRCLPLVLDLGTDNARLLADPLYVGLRAPRARGEAARALRDELLAGVRRRFGASVLVDAADVDHATAQELVVAHRASLPVYADAVHGVPAAVLAGLYAALPAAGGALSAHRFMLVGDGPDLVAVAELLEEAVQREHRSGTVWEARKRIWLVDAGGLLVRDRPDADAVEDHRLPYVQEEGAAAPSLLDAVRAVRPTVLIGLSAGTPAWAFTQDVLREMAAHCDRPVVMPLSRADADGIAGFGEVSAADAHAWTGGRALFADALTNRSLEVEGVGGREARAANPVYIYPGLCQGVIMSRSTRLREDMLIAAARAVAEAVTDEDRALGALYPPLTALQDTAASVAAAVAAVAYHAGVASELPQPSDLLAKAYAVMHDPTYRQYD
ncbi:MME6 [Auxenochlorella protothecoides x Auxenochlorella symbiontica]